ncbi:MAG: polysaccharide biosynthesis C-terminal domain-containing protein [Puniceicoccales bacterium]|jgi:MATE family multidrug resistance protein|nr:polysaccharide biosynthesis C-terminal domain-containing protein [Puniceicoccales bacterium]
MDGPEKPLTPHPPGGLRELFAIAWPMILSAAAGCLMVVSDRLILARYSLETFSANIACTPCYWAVGDIAMSIISIAGVLVGRYNGARQYAQIGPVVWQMLWFSVLLWLPIHFILLPLLPHFLAENVRELGSVYLRILFYFLPVSCAGFGALGSFFVGRGQTKIVLVVTLISIAINFVANVILIFGWGPIPSLGIAGSALGTGLAQSLSFFLFLFLFLQKKHRRTYRTGDASLRWELWRQCLCIGSPNALTRLINSFLWAWMMQLCVQYASGEEFLIYGMAMTVFVAFFFLIEGTGAGVTTVDSNAIGARRWDTVARNTRSWVLLGFLFCGLLSLFMVFYPEPLFRLFAIDLRSGNLRPLIREFFGWAWLLFFAEFFHFNFYSMITAFGDTVFRMISAPLCYGFLVALPVHHILCHGSHRALAFIQYSLLNELVMSLLFFLRYRWLLNRAHSSSPEAPSAD